MNLDGISSRARLVYKRKNRIRSNFDLFNILLIDSEYHLLIEIYVDQKIFQQNATVSYHIFFALFLERKILLLFCKFIQRTIPQKTVWSPSESMSIMWSLRWTLCSLNLSEQMKYGRDILVTPVSCLLVTNLYFSSVKLLGLKRGRN